MRSYYGKFPFQKLIPLSLSDLVTFFWRYLLRLAVDFDATGIVGNLSSSFSSGLVAWFGPWKVHQGEEDPCITFFWVFGRNLGFRQPPATIVFGSLSSWIIQPSLKVSWFNLKCEHESKD
ncbi:hypothetical protein RchiOBHm_Chr4g0407631 [Rosa chinensis]|uniref:Uncharacterized protein n=1 Tax=Rosa chinensis TaxID=74649 RepID=A0A2P6QUL9_ROSCH|nr:hypothetical protein RchiOBHm_Chr4g0407631 [Rosa chinensis]